jgi:cytochrome c oxidase assembly protein subunit 15
MKNRTALMVIRVALLLAFIVVVLGAYARLTDSGLGCPDWPGCYGHLVLPQSPPGLEEAQKAYPDQLVEPQKAWKEMIHRYAAGTLGVLILVLFVQAIVKRFRKEDFPLGICTALVFLLVFQAVLGMWTVTWKLLPLVVMGHLLGGLAILSTLRVLYLTVKYDNQKSTLSLLMPDPVKSHKAWCVMGLILVILQIALGGWVSSNYASLACVGFPTCNGFYVPPMDWQAAFDLFSPIGIDYAGGKLDSAARIAIQMAHRLNAVLTAIFLFVLGAFVLVKERTPGIRRSAIIAMVLVCIQFSLGIILVTHLLPLNIAVAHNAVAALLLLTMISWLFQYKSNYSARSRRSS